MDGRPRMIVLACALALFALLVRIAYIVIVPDFDGDAYAHYEFASQVIRHPGDLKVHWIWLPGFHFLVAGLQTLGATFKAVRIGNALLQAVAPLLLYRYARLRESNVTAVTAAGLWGVSSLGNLLGTTALAEVSFTLLVLGACVAMDSGRALASALVAGVLLTAASSMRYEAWFVVVVLAGWWALVSLRARRVDGRLLATVAVPALLIALYVLVRRSLDHEWLWFVRETYRFTHMQRGLSTASPIFDVLWFPIILPAILLGPAVLLLPVGLAAQRGERPARPSMLVPIALVAFLALTYLGRGALGQARYLTVLMPFACLGIAKGCEVVARRAKKSQRAVSALVTTSVLATAILYVGTTAKHALQNEANLRAREARADGMRPR